jgi:trk system potassium uptake protein
MKLSPMLRLVSWCMLGLAAAMVVPGSAGVLAGERDAGAFFASAAGIGLLGVLLFFGTRRTQVRIYPKQTFLLTSMTWLSAATVSAVPLMLIGHISFTDAFFEAMSGITTTGSTVLTGLDDMPRSILLWRSMLQWFGGLGFILMAVAILPFLGVGGMRLFRSESSEWTDKSMPRVRNMALWIASIYGGLTIACTAGYALAGMDAFDAVNHSMTTVATGGYSTSDASMGKFDAAAVHWVGVLFMMLGSLPFVLYVRALRGETRAMLDDEQVRGFVRIVLVVVLVLALWLTATSDLNAADALRMAAFNVVSIVTTTGYASVDYTAWGSFAVVVFFYLMFVGGCSGSTAGSVKIFRTQIATRVLNRQVMALIHPSGVFNLRFNGRTVNEDIVRSIVAFSFAFFATIAVLTLLLSMLGLDIVTSLSAATTAVSNVGPGLGDIVGPAGNFATLPSGAKWALCLGMLLGRLEILTIAVLFSRHFWRS